MGLMPLDTRHIIWNTTRINTALEGIMGLKLEVGKYYRTRDGRKVGPMINVHGLIFHNHHQDRDLNMQVWEDDGSVHAEREGESGQTIIAEWTDAPTGPVRTVTRKEIVPGSYGPVIVGDGLAVSMAKVYADEVSELRAAIVTLTEIAEALEEQ